MKLQLLLVIFISYSSISFSQKKSLSTDIENILSKSKNKAELTRAIQKYSARKDHLKLNALYFLIKNRKNVV